VCICVCACGGGGGCLGRGLTTWWQALVDTVIHSNKPFASIKGGEFLDYLNDCQLFSKDSSLELVNGCKVKSGEYCTGRSHY
jgi:hypothetical protein